MSRIVGIDLGTTNCCVAWLEGGRVQILPMDDGSKIMPSVVVMDPAAPLGATGHLTAADAARTGARLVADPVGAWSLVDGCDRLYTVTSHVGFEAALAGRPVTCFGMPFYAGWGFSDDRLHLARRSLNLQCDLCKAEVQRRWVSHSVTEKELVMAL